MFLLNELSKTIDERKRVGRGYASGLGKTCGRGSNGQNSRTGRCVKRNFDGSGQNKFFRSIPKRGFNSIKTRFGLCKSISISSLEHLLTRVQNSGSKIKTVDIHFLRSNDFVPMNCFKFKIIGSDRVEYLKNIDKLEFKVNCISSNAKNLIENFGHSVSVL